LGGFFRYQREFIAKSNSTEKFTIELDKLLAAPSHLAINILDDSEIHLSWVDNNDHEDGFIVERFGDDSWERIADVVSNVTLILDSGLDTENNIYQYRVLTYIGKYQSNYSNTISTPAPTVKDIDGNVYRTVLIGNQHWMAENLKVAHYRNGDAIPNVPVPSTWENLTTGALCYYYSDWNNYDTYGNLYNYYAVADQRNIAPKGWHVPNDLDWKILIDYLGGGKVAGGKLKEIGILQGESLKTIAINENRFSALLGGQRFGNCEFINMGYNAYFWTSTESDNNHALSQRLTSLSGGVKQRNVRKHYGYAVRCVRD